MPSALIALAAILSSGAAAVGPAGHDEAELLYSTQLSFDEQGVPVVTVGVMDGQTKVTLSARAGLVISLSGPAQSEVSLPPGHSVAARVEGGVPGRTRHRVVLGSVKGSDLRSIRELHTLWRDRGLTTESVELGGMVGFPGRVIDNRATMVVEAGHHVERAKAEERARDLVTAWQLAKELRIHSDSVSRPSGRIVLVDETTGTTIRQHKMITLRAADRGPIEVQRVEFGKGYAHHGFADRQFDGAILLALDPDAQLAVVNRVSSETLLRGLVPAEIFPTAPPAALDAQAITARSELLAKVGVRHLADPYLVCARQHCQVYSGKSREKPSTNQAVARTRGRMLFGPDDRLVDAVYSASCGGHTEHNEHVWGGAPRAVLRGHPDAQSRTPKWKAAAVPTEHELLRFILDPPDTWCGTSTLGRKVYRWTRDLPDAELDRMVNARHPIGRVQAIEVLERGVSGRVIRVRFVGAKAHAEVRGELNVRRLLGNLRSGMFVVRHDKGVWRFVGGGWGHGVGMCQYGAIGMAQSGKSGAAILKHYYGGSQVHKVY